MQINNMDELHAMHQRVATELARDYVKSHGRTDVVTFTEDTDLGEVATLLEPKQNKRVSEGKVVGIISRANIVRAVGRQGCVTAQE
jgi:CBS domain-containing protein